MVVAHRGKRRVRSFFPGQGVFNVVLLRFSLYVYKVVRFLMYIVFVYSGHGI